MRKTLYGISEGIISTLLFLTLILFGGRCFCQNVEIPPDVIKKDFFRGEILLTTEPKLNQKLVITLKLNPIDDFDNLKIRISVDNGIKLISGIKKQDYSAQKGIESSFQYLLQIDEGGFHQIKFVVFDEHNSALSNMYFISFLSSTDKGIIFTNQTEMLEYKKKNQNSIQLPFYDGNRNLEDKTPLKIQKDSINSKNGGNNADNPESIVNISGRLRYEDVTTGDLLPVRYATVKVFQYGILWDTEIGSGNTDNTGNFNVTFNCNGSIDICVKIYNESSAAKCVVDDILGGIYEVRFPEPGFYYNIDCSNTSYTIGTGWYVSENYPNWQAVDNCISEYQWIANQTSNWTRSQVKIVYPDGTWPVSYGNSIHLCDMSYFPWDNTTLFHEYGHCVMYTIYGGTWPGGCSVNPHNPMSVSCEGFALTEGWAEFMSGSVINDPNSVFWFETCANTPPNNLETNEWWKGENCNNTNGAIVEGSVASILWDIYDNPGSDDDDLQLGFNNSGGSIWHIILSHTPYGMNEFWDRWTNHYQYRQPLWSIYFDNGINKDFTAPNNPTSITSSSHGISTWSSDRTIDVSWSGATDDLSGVAGYSWEWSTSATTLPDQDMNGTGTSTTSFTLNDGNNWYFHIRTKDNAGNWNSSAVHLGPFFIDANPPLNPTSITSSSHQINTWNTDRTIDISWSGASDGGGSGVAGYSWSWDSSPSSIPDNTIDGTGNSTTCNPLEDGNNWYFHIRTKDNAGNWNSTTVHMGPFFIDANPPSNPTSITSTSHQVNTWSSDRTIDISWSGANDGSGSGIAGYSWSWDNSPTTIPDNTLDGTGSSATSQSLNDGNNWYFHLKTKDNAGMWSSTAVHIGPFFIDGTAPGNPNTVTSSSHQLNTWSADNTIDVSWSGANDGTGSGVAGYSWSWDNNSTTIPDNTVDGTSSSTTSPALADGNNWYFHIKTKDVAGNWNSAAVHKGPFYIDANAPINPTSITSTSHQINTWNLDKTIDISWSGSSDGGGSGIEGYSWSWDSSPSSIPDNTIDGTGTSTTSFTLNDGNNWYFHIRTKDNAGNWNSTAVHMGPFFIDGTAPGNPTTVTSPSHQLNTWNSDYTIDISWSGAGDGSGSGIAGYSWSWDNNSTTIPDNIVDGTGSSATSPSLADGNNWYFHIKTKDIAGNWNSAAVHKGPFYIDANAPVNPTSISSTSHQISIWNSDRTIDFSWSGANDGSGSGIEGYSWSWDNSSTTIPDNIVDGTGSFTTSASLSDGNNWYFHIKTKDNSGNWNMTASHSGPYFVDGTPPINGIIAINYGVVSTPFLAVSLNSLYASDPSSGLSQMRFSSNNSTWSPFESYSANKFGWDLSQYGGNINYGIKTVYVKFRDNAGNESISYFDDIQYISGISPEVFLQDIAVSSGQSSCYNATETVNIAGNGTTFIVQNGGIAIIIAGQNIHFLSGTFGKQGGYLHGYITTDDQYCGGQPNTMITKTIESIEIPVSNLRQSNFKTYPNPTTGNFILELPGDLQTKKIQVDIFGMRGEMVLTATLNGERKHEFSLSDKPTGVYFIRIVSGDKTETLKIIKQ